MKPKKIILIVLLIIIIVVLSVGIKIVTSKGRTTAQLNKIDTNTVTNQNKSNRPGRNSDNATVTNTENNITDGGNNTAVADDSLPTNISGIDWTADVQLKDDYFLTNINDMYLNHNGYLGKTISYEGFIFNDKESNVMVVGRDYYCCGYDAYIVGLECEYNGIKLSDNLWVKIKGVIQLKDNVKEAYPYVKVTSIVKLNEAGQRYVSN